MSCVGTTSSQSGNSQKSAAADRMPMGKRNSTKVRCHECNFERQCRLTFECFAWSLYTSQPARAWRPPRPPPSAPSAVGPETYTRTVPKIVGSCRPGHRPGGPFAPRPVGGRHSCRRSCRGCAAGAASDGRCPRGCCSCSLHGERCDRWQNLWESQDCHSQMTTEPALQLMSTPSAILFVFLPQIRG